MEFLGRYGEVSAPYLLNIHAASGNYASLRGEPRGLTLGKE
jgi:hypothetical protein